MSDNWMILIPTDPEFIPNEGAVKGASERLRRLLPEADEIKSELSERPRFIDCGANLEHVYCPHTGKEIPLELWQGAMGRAYESGFRDLSFVSPHSGKSTSLAELVYDWPQGFARFSLEAMNPNVESIPDEDLHEFERLLGCRLRVIWQHI